jgi:pyruvyl transferase EpsO
MKLKSISSTSDLIIKNLSPIIDRDYVLYDIPNHRNIGDQLIYQGELDFLSRLPHKCLSSCSVSYNFLPTPKTDLILLHGGGNFGDIYPLHQNFREKIIRNNLDKEIILFPNSVQFRSQDALAKTAAVFNAHPRLTICARDAFSFELLKKYFFNCKVIALPDMAFCSNYAPTTKPSKPLAIIQRTDVELQEEDLILPEGDFEVIDWLTFQDSLDEKLHLYYYSLNRRISEFVLRLLNRNSIYGLFPLRKQKEFINIGIKQLSQYEFVISTRLHGHILALLLGIPSIMVDNNYGKNKRYFKSWLPEMPNSHFASSVSEALELYEFLKDKNAKEVKVRA